MELSTAIKIITTWAPWLILIVLILVLFRYFKSKSTVLTEASEISNVKYRYRQRRKFCSESEAEFLAVLEQAAGGSIRVFCKVHASYVLIPRMELSIENWNSSFDKIVAKQIDYVLCAASDMSILCIILLSSKKNKKSSFDKFLKNACRSAEIPLIHLVGEKEYTAAECRYLLKKHIPDAFAEYKKKTTIPVPIESKKIKQAPVEESLQEMLLQEGRRRAMKLKRMQANKSESS